jgi:gliding motility-associated-like protein
LLFDASCNPADVGVFMQNLVNQYGCDSIVVTEVNLLPSDAANLTAFTCDPAAAGIFIQNLTNRFGCDSIVTQTVTLLPTDTTLLTRTTCDPAQTGSAVLVLNNQFGCDSVVITVTKLPPLPVQVSLGDDITIEMGDQVTLQAVVSIPVDSLASVVWSINDSTACPQCLSQIVMPLISSIYAIQVTADNGCADADTLRVLVDRGRKIYIPNAFSPNDDGINDILMIFSKPGAVRQVKSFQIFDRWGEAVFRQENFQPNDPGFGWDGVYRGKAMSPGVYAWVAEIEFIDGVTEVFSGDATVVR